MQYESEENIEEMLMKMRKTWRKREENKEETMKKYLIMAM
jgi:hypothetical protein